MAAPSAGERVLDLAAGTGAFGGAIKAVSPEVRLVAADFCLPILSLCPPRLAARVGADGLKLPFRAGAFDAFVIAFGIRNFSDPAAGLAEMRRVLKPGGRGVILEFLQPESSFFGFLYRIYLGFWVPLLGGLMTGSFSSYRHLTDTIRGFYSRPAMRRLLEDAEFSVVSMRDLTFGAATAIVLRKIS